MKRSEISFLSFCSIKISSVKSIVTFVMFLVAAFKMSLCLQPMLVPKEITVSQTQLKFGSNLSLSKAATRENTIDKTTEKTAESDDEDDEEVRHRRRQQQIYATMQVRRLPPTSASVFG